MRARHSAIFFGLFVIAAALVACPASLGDRCANGVCGEDAGTDADADADADAGASDGCADDASDARCE